MKGRRLILALFALAIILGIAFVINRDSVSDPVYHGKRASVWVSELNASDHEIQDKAGDAIRELGPTAVPLLSRNIRVTGLGRHPALNLKIHSLASHLPRRTRQWIYQKLGFTGGYFAGSGAAIALQEMGADARAAVPALLDALVDTDANVRSCAACALIRIAPDDEHVTSVLQDILIHDRESWILSNVSNGFDDLNSTDTAAIPLLRRTLVNSTNSYARMNAARALGKFEKTDSRIYGDLTNALADPDPYVDIGALQGLSRLGIAVTNATSILIEALRSSNGGLRALAASELAERRPVVKEAVPALIGLLSSTDGWTRLSAAKAIWKMTGEKETLLPILMNCTRDGTGNWWFESAEILADMGEETDTAVSLLVKRIASGPIDPGNAIAALVKVGPAASNSVPQLKEALHSDGVRERLAAAEALWEIEPQSEELLPLLMNWLQTGGTFTKVRTAAILGQMGAEARDALPILRSLLQDQSSNVREAAAAALKEIEVSETTNAPSNRPIQVREPKL